MRNPYEVLGVPRNATEEEIKRAYRKGAKECHPDANPNDPSAEERFKELSEAYAILSDPQKRQQFDTFGSVGGRDPFAGMGGFDISDALRMFMESFGGGDPFGGGFFGERRSSRGRHSRQRKGQDLRVTVEVSLEDILHGVPKKIRLAKKVVCPECGGSGVPAGAKERVCPTCNGSGRIRTVRTTLLGSFSTVVVCPACGGSGVKVSAYCSRCSGEGRINGRDEVELKVPPGVSEGNYVVIQGKGDAGIAGGPPGDLIVFFKELPHKRFSRRGNDLYLRLPLSFPQAALGDEIDVPTLDGKNKRLKIPAGTQFGQTFRIKGCGLPKIHSRSRGDLIVTAFIKTPKKLSKREKELYKQLEKSSDSSDNDTEDIFERLKELFK